MQNGSCIVMSLLTEMHKLTTITASVRGTAAGAALTSLRTRVRAFCCYNVNSTAPVI
jgi:hypothetical protein